MSILRNVGWDINSYSISRAVAKTNILRSQPDYKEMTSRRDSETGQYEEVYADEEILKLLTGTRLGTSEVADQLNCHRTTAHDKLTQLEQEGLVNSTSVGNTLVWELADE
jgi:DNA-binding GntR family transcriptional regulator